MKVRKPMTEDQLNATFGKFSYTSNKDGSVQIDQAWVRENIATLHTVLVPNIVCHIKAARQIAAALHKVYLEGLGNIIKTYDGCFVPRHKLWNPKKSLSEHSYGIALDFNAATNPFGKYSNELEPVAQIFDEFGIGWGGTWSPKYADPMHFFLYTCWE